MEGGAWYEEYDDDDFLDNYGEATEVPDPERKKTKLLDSNDAEQPKVPRVVKNPRPKLDIERLNNEETGLPELLKMATNITFREGREIKDMRRAIALYKIWSHRLFPNYNFEDFLLKCETLGKKRPVRTHLKKVRSGMIPM